MTETEPRERLPGNCPDCGTALDSAVSVGPGQPADAKPQAGDITICVVCAALLEFTGGEYVKLSPEKLTEAPPDAREALARAQWLIRNSAFTQDLAAATRALYSKFSEEQSTAARKNLRRRAGRAKLVSLRSADGFWNIKVEMATVGKEYEVDLNSARRGQFVNLTTGRPFTCEIIDVWDESQREFIHFPVELLEVTHEPAKPEPGEARYSISPDGKSIECHKCGLVSGNPNDVENKYCGNCHRFHEQES